MMDSIIKIEVTREQFNLIYDALSDKIEVLDGSIFRENNQGEIAKINELLNCLESL